MTARECYFVVADVLSEPLYREVTGTRMRWIHALRIPPGHGPPPGYHDVDAVARVVAVQGTRIELVNAQTSYTSADLLHVGVHGRFAAETGPYVSSLVDCREEATQMLVESMLALQSPSFAPARRLLRAMVATAMVRTRELESPLALLDETTRRATHVEAELLGTVRKLCVCAALVYGTIDDTQGATT